MAYLHLSRNNIHGISQRRLMTVLVYRFRAKQKKVIEELRRESRKVWNQELNACQFRAWLTTV